MEMKALNIALLVVIVLGGSCGLISTRLRSTKEVSAGLSKACVVEALRADEAVRRVHVQGELIRAELNMPRGKDTPDVMAWVTVEVIHMAGNQAVLHVVTGWRGYGPVGTERETWQVLLDGLRDRIIARCGVN
jgi:hypothetical protein